MQGAIIRADLHTHSSASDGDLAPAALVSLAKQQGLAYLALTDHDTTAGLPEAEAAAQGVSLSFIPGIELTTDVPLGELHVLGYAIDRDDSTLQETLQSLRQARVERLWRVLARLSSLGIDLDPARITPAHAGEAVGRPHIARALVETGHATSIADAFDRYLGDGKPAFVQKDRIAPDAAVRLIRAAGGIPVLAHPLTVVDLDDWLGRLIPAGLRGLECYYGKYSAAQRNNLVTIADEYGLIATAGSDFHGAGFDPRQALGSVDIPSSRFDAFVAELS